MKKIHFEDRVVIITGAGNGLGKDYALQFARLGAHVLVNDFGKYKHKSKGERYFADDVVDEIVDKGGSAIANHDNIVTGAKNIIK